MIRAVIIDIDDTFSLTEAVSFELENSVLKHMGYPPMSRQIHLETWEMRPSEAIAARVPGIDVEAFRAQYATMLAECKAADQFDLIPDANYAALDQLRAQNKMVMVLTARLPEQVAHLLEPNHPLARRIQAFYHRDSTRFRKPDPRVFDDMLRQANVAPRECVYVGDSLNDVKATKNAGLFFIASLESGLRQKDDFADYAVDAFIQHFPDVVTAVAHLDTLHH